MSRVVEVDFLFVFIQLENFCVYKNQSIFLYSYILFCCLDLLLFAITSSALFFRLAQPCLFLVSRAPTIRGHSLHGQRLTKVDRLLIFYKYNDPAETMSLCTNSAALSIFSSKATLPIVLAAVTIWRIISSNLLNILMSEPS